MSVVNDFLEKYGYEEVYKPKKTSDQLKYKPASMVKPDNSMSKNYIRQDLKRKHSISKSRFSMDNSEALGQADGEYDFPDELPRNNVERAIKSE